jgi:hypothetical protein
MAGRINSALANILALDDPRATAVVEREIVENARRIGQREQETVTIGNMAEDIRRTGDWDWIVGELERAIRDEDRNVNDLLLEAALTEFRVLRGEAGSQEVDAIATSLGDLEDLDVSTSALGLRATVDLFRGAFSSAAAGWISQADGSDLNAPYALPKAGHAAVLAKDPDLAQRILDRLAAIGSRGRAIEADIDGIRAGVAALRGDRAASLAGYRDVRARFRDLGLDWDVALLALPAATVLGADEPEVGEWLGESRAVLERLRAKPMLALLDGLGATAPAKGRAGATSRDGAGEAAKAQAEASSSST